MHLCGLCESKLIGDNARFAQPAIFKQQLSECILEKYINYI